jgi:3-dehydroquinate dehydratase-2
MFPGPVIEFHISNIHRREEIYHKPLVSTVATAVLAGLDPQGYAMAVKALIEMIEARHGKPAASAAAPMRSGPT